MNIVEFDRFFVDEDQFDLYKELEKDEEFVYYGNSHPQIFLLSSCLGYKLDSKKVLKNKKGLTQKTSVLNVKNADVIYRAFSFVAEKESEINDQDELLVNKVMEEYAKGGFEKLYEILNTPSSKNENLKFYMIREI